MFLGEQAVKKGFLLVVTSLLSMAGTGRAEEGKLGVTFNTEDHSKWLSKGAEVYGQQGAVFETVDLDLYGTGLFLRVTHRSATGSGYADDQRIDYRPGYRGVLFEDQSYATNYHVSAGYEHYYGLARNRSNTTWEWHFGTHWPNILPNGLIPGYLAICEYAAGSNYTKPSGADIPSGWVHRFMLRYDLKRPQIPVPIRLTSDVNYTDGLGGAAHDWSYATFGAATKLEIADNLAFIPGVYHQISMDDSVNTRKDITYCIVHLRYGF